MQEEAIHSHPYIRYTLYGQTDRILVIGCCYFVSFASIEYNDENSVFSAQALKTHTNIQLQRQIQRTLTRFRNIEPILLHYSSAVSLYLSYSRTHTHTRAGTSCCYMQFCVRLPYFAYSVKSKCNKEANADIRRQKIKFIRHSHKEK